MEDIINFAVAYVEKRTGQKIPRDMALLCASKAKRVFDRMDRNKTATIEDALRSPEVNAELRYAATTAMDGYRASTASKTA